MRRFAVILTVCGVVGGPWAHAPGGDEHLYAAGPHGVAYVGLIYGLADVQTGSWYVAWDWLEMYESRAWMAAADTGTSACLLGLTTQESYIAYDGVGIPLQPYPAVQFVDEGFGGSTSFAVTEPVRMMIADFKTALNAPDPEDPSLYTAYGPIGGPEPPSIKMAAARELIGGGILGLFDFDILGMSVLEGKVLHVDPHYLESFQLFALAMAGSLERPPPPPSHPRALYVPVTMQSFFSEPQAVDVGEHPLLPVGVRKEPTDPLAVRTALFDTGSPVTFVSETFAVEAGIDLESPWDLTVAVGGIGSGQQEAPGWYVDAVVLELGNGREGDSLVIHDSAVFVLADEDMPGDLDAILGCGAFSPYLAPDMSWFRDTTLLEWYVDTRDPENAWLILVPAKPGDANFDDVADGADYTLWADNYMFEGFWEQGDFNQDGFVDGADYTLWADNYEPTPMGVPEPSVMLLVAAGAALIVRRRNA